MGNLDGREAEPHDQADVAIMKPATFQGRLQLKNFMYLSAASTPASSAPPQILRRSTRHAASRVSSATSTASRAAAITTSAALTPTQKSPSLAGTQPKPLKRRPSPASIHAAASTLASPPSPRKKRSKTSSGYAPPSTYAHLPLLPDAVAPNLLIFFVGLNPGIETARKGHCYAHPSNLFWKLLFSSGVTPRPCRPEEDRRLPELYGLGFTNIVARPTRNGAELSRQEMDDGVAMLEDKARRWRPESMCIVGKSIWESVWRVRHGNPVGRSFRYGWQDEAENMGVIDGEWAGARVFVASSTSGLAATLSPAEKQQIWSELGVWVTMRRAELDAQAQRERDDEGKVGAGS